MGKVENILWWTSEMGPLCCWLLVLLIEYQPGARILIWFNLNPCKDE